MSNFEQLVLKMRTAQKKYFKTRNSEALHTARMLEMSVDKMLEENGVKPEPDVKHPDLFGGKS